MSGDCNAAALEVLRRELTPASRAALAHLLGNALCPLALEVASPDAEVSLPLIREAVRELTRRVRMILQLSS